MEVPEESTKSSPCKFFRPWMCCSVVGGVRQLLSETKKKFIKTTVFSCREITILYFDIMPIEAITLDFTFICGIISTLLLLFYKKTCLEVLTLQRQFKLSRLLTKHFSNNKNTIKRIFSISSSFFSWRFYIS